MHRLSRVCLRHQIVTFVVSSLVVLASIYAIFQLKMEILPSATYPAFLEIAITPEVELQKVVEDITIPIEDSFSPCKGLRNLLSLSAPGMSVVMGEFYFGTNADETGKAIQQEIGEKSLPPGTMPMFIPFSMEMLPVIILGVGGTDISPAYAREVALERIIPKLKEIEGVSFLPGQEVIGGESEKGIIISPNPEKMSQGKVSFAKIVSTLEGREFSSLEDITSCTISDVTLGDIAELSLDYPGGVPICQLNGAPIVGVLVEKKPTANTVEVAWAVRDKVEEVILPPGFEVDVIFDQTEYIEKSIDELILQGVIGAILAIVAVFLFLRTFCASSITALSIPLSLLLGFLLMYLFGLDLNVLTLSAVAIAVGRVIDNTIVIVENIYRHLQMGKSFTEAASDGCREVANAISSSTLATVVVFVPLVFIGGIAIVLFRPFALALTLLLFASLIIALMLIPPLCSFISPKEGKEVKYREESFYHRAYEKVLRRSLSNRKATLIVAVVLLFGSFGILPFIGTYLIPELEEEILVTETVLPPGSTTEEVADKLALAEKILEENVDTQRYLSIGGGSDVSGGGALSLISLVGVLYGGSTSLAETMAFLNPGADSRVESAKFEEMARGIEGAEVTVYTPEGLMNSVGMGPSALQFSISGKNPQEVKKLGQKVKGLLGETEGLVSVKTTISEPKLQFRPKVDTLRAKACGLSPEEVKEELLLMQEDQLVSFLNLGEREYEVYVKELAGRLENLTQWENLWVGEGTLHLLGDIATIEEVPSPPMGIRRYNRQETEFITASIRGRNKGAITREVSERVESIPHPGVEVEIGGMEEMIQENFRWMFIAIITAIPLLYFTLVGIFRSFSNSGLVMLSLPFALIGAFLALLITQKPMGVIGLGGILMLEGIVLSNAIVFLVFVEQLRQSGKSVYDSLIEGGKIRLRPILMTSLTTMLALFPLALAGTYGGIVVTDLAIVVIGGLFTSTVLTLIILPVIYSLIHHT